MDFALPPRAAALRDQLLAFMDAHIHPNEARYAAEVATGDRWQPVPVIEELKPRARAAGLWNLFLPDTTHGAGLTNQAYAPLCEIMGRVMWAPEVFNCSAPDTGNMEVLARYGSPEQQSKWLIPLLNGEIRSAFAMTEPAVASSDATNIQARIERVGDDYIITGTKWWTSGIGDPRCRVLIVMGRTNPEAPTHLQQSMILVPRDAPGLRVERMLPLFGFDDAPHGHGLVHFDGVRVPATNLILGEGRGFEIAQGRLGPGRIHHCMRLLGLTERALEAMCQRLTTRTAFGKPLAEQGVWRERVADARIALDQARLLTLHAAWLMDTVGNKGARQAIGMIKVAAPRVACQVIDHAIQAFGAAGVTDDATHFGLAQAYAWARALRIADGPDEVHQDQIARLELQRHQPRTASDRRNTSK